MKMRERLKANKEVLVIAGLLGLLPLLLAVIYCGAQGKMLWEVFVPNSYWNDELFYYKQVDGILERGLPGGYFGFNESRGRYLSFAAWSPVLLLPWCIWGFMFGWTYLSPVICNLVIMMCGMVGFALLARPDRRQAAVLAEFYGIFTPLTRFTLSAMPEAVCIGILLWYMGLLLAYGRGEESARKKSRYLVIMLILSGVLTLMRPYFILFMLYPVYCRRRQGWKKAVLPLAAVILVFVGYSLIKYCFSAEYLHDLYDLSFITIFFREGVAAGIQNLLQELGAGVAAIYDLLKKGLKMGNYPGALYGTFGVLGVLLLTAGVILRCKKEPEEERHLLPPICLLLFVMTGMMAAILLMYKAGEGGRHLMGFILMGVVVLAFIKAKSGLVMQGLAAVLMIYYFVVKAGTPYDYQLSFDDGYMRGQINQMQEVLESRMEMDAEIGWNNTVIWLAYDLVGEAVVSESWQYLYGIPAGYGINFCTLEYINEHYGEIKSRYIAAIPGGSVEARIVADGGVRVNGDEAVVVYDLWGGDGGGEGQ